MPLLLGALNLQDLKIMDQEKTIAGKCKIMKMTEQIARLEIT